MKYVSIFCAFALLLILGCDTPVEYEYTKLEDPLSTPLVEDKEVQLVLSFPDFLTQEQQDSICVHTLEARSLASQVTNLQEGKFIPEGKIVYLKTWGNWVFAYSRWISECIWKRACTVDGRNEWLAGVYV